MATKIIRSEELGDVEAWDRSGMGFTGPGQKGASVVTAQQLQNIQKQAYDEGFEVGRKEGFEFGHDQGVQAGRSRIEETSVTLKALLGYMEHPFRDLDEQIGEELVNLAIAIARQLVHRELQTDPEQVIAVVREALMILPESARSVKVQLHPQDAELVREQLIPDNSNQIWRIVDDPVLSRGDCKVSTETSVVDATLESRITAIAATMLAAERTDESR